MNGGRSSCFMFLLLGLGAVAFAGNGLAEEQVIVLEEVQSVEPVVTLERSLEFAFEKNPDIDASQWNTIVAGAQVTQAKSAYMPQLSGAVQYDRGYYPIGTNNTGKREEFNSYTIGVSGEQYIYGFGKVIGKIRASKQSYSASLSDYDTSVADVIREVSRAYYEVLKKQELIVVNEENVATREAHLEQARAFHRRGIRPLVDVMKGEVDLSQARLALIKADYNLEMSVVDYEQVLGGAPVQGSYALANVPVEVVRQGDVQPLLDAALARRPEVKSRKAQVNAAKANYRAAWGNYWPSLTANGQWGWLDTAFPLHNAWLVGARVSWDFFPGLKTVGEVREAKASINVLQAQLKREELLVIQQVSQAYLALSQMAESIRTAEVEVQFASEYYALVQGRYRAGLADAIEYNDAALDLTRARSELVQYRYDYLQSEADLIRACGGGFMDLWERAEAR